jgi:peroxiredoxin
MNATASQSRKLIKELNGTRAPDWTIKDVNGNDVSLSDLKRKVVVLQFTGIGCGPCHQAMPFLKAWANESSQNNFEVVGIETWSRNQEGIKRYFDKNAINYKFLKADSTIMSNYRIYSVPVFFVLDENRIIRQVISGYERDVSDTKLREAVKELL